MALKRLAKPISGEATLRMKMELTSKGQLSTGFLAFGDSTRADQLVRCGIRLRMKKAMILQGKSSKDESAAVEVVAQLGRTVNMEVAVDLPHRKIRLTCDGATVEAHAGSAHKIDHPRRLLRRQCGHRLRPDRNCGPLRELGAIPPVRNVIHRLVSDILPAMDDVKESAETRSLYW